MVARLVPCGSCGVELPPNSRFCNQCGAPVVPVDRSAEYKQVTVLFADVVRSMDIAASVDLERLRDIMTELLERLVAVARRYGGGTMEYTGDGLMVLFGAPIALEDHAFRACLAALAIQEEAQRLAAEVLRADGVALQLRVGLNSGRVIVGQAGAGSPRNAPAGETIGFAQRMESVAPPGGVMLSASTARLVESIAHLGEAQLVHIKGAERPVPARCLLGIPEQPNSAQPAGPHLVGRQSEMAALRGLFDRGMDGRGAVVRLVGVPGIGKSRLVREVSDLASARNVEVFSTFGESHASDVPFRVVARLLRTATGVHHLDGAAARARIRGQFPDADPDDVLLFDDLLGIADPDVELPRVDPDARRRRMTGLVNSALLTRQAPAVYIVEDAHWSDAISASMVADFLSVIPQTRSLVVITYRPEYDGTLARLPGAETIALEPLGARDAASLIGRLLGRDESVDLLGDTIAERAAGNPFFAIEMVRELADRGVLEGNRGEYVSNIAAATVDVPATLQAAIAARIDRLQPKVKRALSTAAVIGSRIDRNVLDALQMESEIVELVTAEFIDQVPSTGQPEYVFHHPLIRAVAYESMLKSDRADVHRRVAAAIESRDPAAAEENAALIAEHLDSAGELRAAYGWHMRAARWATSRDIAAARSSWERARLIADALPEGSQDRTMMRIAPRTMLCGTAYRVHAAGIDEHVEELRQLCSEAGDKASLAIAMAGLVMDHVYQGRVQEGSRLASESMALIESIGDDALTVGLSFPAIYAKIESAEYSDVLRWSQGMVDSADGDPSKGNFIFGSPLALALASRAVGRYCLGHTEWADDVRNGVVMARNADPLTYSAVVAWGYFPGIMFGALVADDRAVAEIQDALRVAERSGNNMALAFARLALGVALVHRNSVAERDQGHVLLTDVSDTFLRQQHNLGDRPLVDVYVARESARRGDRDAALSLMVAAVEHFVSEGRLVGWGVPATGVLVETLLDRGGPGDLDRAEAAVERLAAAPTDHEFAMRQVWVLRLRALVARAYGDHIAYREYRARYRDAATSRGFEGHMVWASSE
ncbi:cyclase [Mycolicibacterium sphagni]|uniref:Cyclase n=1 Tax=Mycolicibacterium sphagni TaxID=1786 RepID=A0ABX2JX19_9MYCO|nr:adenylate/guanylate cyclase domain-containing protein [Mycolicibacterium sphagni]NTY61975.1 cyclase [Mycolicibacterium sphagni]